MSSPKTWLITGASTGLGKSLALAALSAGDKVIGTSRNISQAQQSSPEFASHGGIWLEADPGNKDVGALIRKVAEEHDVDVLVNNSGYAFIGAVEDTSEEELRSQMEVNFYGPLRLVKACLPTMRSNRRGTIVLISSGAALISQPTRSAYSASKTAIEFLHEALSREISPFDVKVLIVEPGAFRTPFSTTTRIPAEFEGRGGFSEAYDGTVVETMVRAARGLTADLGFARGDPDKAGRAIVRAVGEGNPTLRLPLGRDCLGAVERKIEELRGVVEGCAGAARGTDVDE